MIDIPGDNPAIELPPAPMGARWVAFSTRPRKGEPRIAPLLEWTSTSAAETFYGPANVVRALNAQGIRVPLQDIVRKLLAKNAPIDVIASAQLAWTPERKYRAPGTAKERKPKAVSNSPRAVSRRIRKAITEDKVSSGAMRAFMERVLKGEVQLDDSGEVVRSTPSAA